MVKPLSINRLAWKLLEELVDNADLYRVKVTRTDAKTLLIDSGIQAQGGFEAGRLITEICMGGCGKASITCQEYGNLELPSIQIISDHPILATLGSQFAGWQIREKGYFAIGSGPARALAQKPKDIYREIGYKDDFDKTVVVLETEACPPAKLVRRLAKDCGVLQKNLAVILTPTTSLAGATQVAGRIVETGIHKLTRLGLDPNLITHACGRAPIPPIHNKFVKAMARTNDAILYGGIVYCCVDHENDKELEQIVKRAPSLASEAYGKPFIEIFREAKYDFYKIDPGLFAPAVVAVNNVRTGAIFKSGKIDVKTLAESFGLRRV
jgi:methenyltetrahydromethanopterin cyclohydrolase